MFQNSQNNQNLFDVWKQASQAPSEGTTTAGNNYQNSNEYTGSYYENNNNADTNVNYNNYNYTNGNTNTNNNVDDDDPGGFFSQSTAPIVAVPRLPPTQNSGFSRNARKRLSIQLGGATTGSMDEVLSPGTSALISRTNADSMVKFAHNGSDAVQEKILEDIEKMQENKQSNIDYDPPGEKSCFVELKSTTPVATEAGDILREIIGLRNLGSNLSRVQDAARNSHCKHKKMIEQTAILLSSCMKHSKNRGRVMSKYIEDLEVFAAVSLRLAQVGSKNIFQSALRTRLETIWKDRYQKLQDGDAKMWL